MKFLCEKENLNTETIKSFLQKFSQYESPRLIKYKRYYDGKHDILNKVNEDDSKPCNKIVNNFCSQIVDNYLGYLVGKDVAYTSTQDITAISEVLAYNDSRTADSELLRQALIYGRAFEVCYVDEEAKQRFKVLDNGCNSVISALSDAVWDEKKQNEGEDVRKDDGTTDIDTCDALEYCIEKFRNDLINVAIATR